MIERFKLYRGDCLDVMPTLATGSVDMVMCDLPYGTTACAWDCVIPVDTLWAEYRRTLTPVGTAVLTAAQPFTTAITYPALDLFKHASIWVKNRPTGPQHAKNRPMSKHEDVLVFSQGKMGHAVQLGQKRMTYNPQGVTDAGLKKVRAKGSHSSLTGARPNQVGREYMAQTGFPHTILNFDKEEDHVHPTQKPVALMEYLIRTYTNEGDLVMDNCMGSGTTGVASMRSGRRFIGIELNDYAQAAALRILEAWGGDTMRTIYCTPFDDETKKATGPSTDSGFTTISEVVDAMGGEWLTCSDRAVVYPGLMFSDYVLRVES